MFDISELLRFATGALGGYHPMRLTLGFAIGVMLKMGIHAAGHSLPEALILSGLDEFNMGYFMFACAPLPFLPLILGRRGAPEGVAHQINTIRALLSEENATQVQRTMIWRAITSKYLAAVQPDLVRGPSLQDLFKEAKGELKPGPEAPS
jgi:hypothetical protein